MHFDSRMHAATKVISLLGGQHGQESEEGEEGEERSEEDCEEDPQGRQEEEVISLRENCRRLDAGASPEPSETICFFEADFSQAALSTKEGVGETSGQTAGSSFEGASSFKPIRQKKQVFFVRCGPPKEIRNFTGPKARIEIWS